MKFKPQYDFLLNGIKNWIMGQKMRASFSDFTLVPNCSNIWQFNCGKLNLPIRKCTAINLVSGFQISLLCCVHPILVISKPFWVSLFSGKHIKFLQLLFCSQALTMKRLGHYSLKIVPFNGSSQILFAHWSIWKWLHDSFDVNSVTWHCLLHVLCLIMTHINQFANCSGDSQWKTFLYLKQSYCFKRLGICWNVPHRQLWYFFLFFIYTKACSH